MYRGVNGKMGSSLYVKCSFLLKGRYRRARVCALLLFDGRGLKCLGFTLQEVTQEACGAEIPKLSRTRHLNAAIVLRGQPREASKIRGVHTDLLVDSALFE